MKELNYGEGYRYPHDYPENFVPQEYLPKEISKTSFYQPGGNPKEEKFKSFLQRRWKDHYPY